MKIDVITISVTELQEAVRDYVEKHAKTQPTTVFVDNGYNKTVLYIPLAPGGTISGEQFQRQTEAS